MSHCGVCDVGDKKPAGRCPACGRNWGPSILDGVFQGPFDDLPSPNDWDRFDPALGIPRSLGTIAMNERYKAVRIDDGKTYGRHIVWRITDGHTDSSVIVANCYVKEYAELVTAALNSAPQASVGRADVNQATPGSPTGNAAAESPALYESLMYVVSALSHSGYEAERESISHVATVVRQLHHAMRCIIECLSADEPIPTEFYDQAVEALHATEEAVSQPASEGHR